jgi:signal transduction histidine kinase
MTHEWSIIGNEGFKFIGKINASMSHEIKNVLAIINEKAGLLEDFLLMAEKGMPVDPGRFRALSGKIQTQVKRADKIVINMNTFAHSADETCKTVEIGQAFDFVAALSARLVSNRGINLEILPEAGPVTIITNPFFLNNMIWLCIDFAMDWTGDGKTIAVSYRTNLGGAEIKLSKLAGLGNMPVDGFPNKREETILEALDGEITICREAGELSLVLPGTIDTK